MISQLLTLMSETLMSDNIAVGKNRSVVAADTTAVMTAHMPDRKAGNSKLPKGSFANCGCVVCCGHQVITLHEGGTRGSALASAIMEHAGSLVSLAGEWGVGIFEVRGFSGLCR